MAHRQYVGAGKAYSVILDVDGNLWGWGSNGYGQLANGKTEQCILPTASILPPLYSIGPGIGHCLAIDFDGKLFAWGWNGFEQLGQPQAQSQHEPKRVPLKTENRIIDVAAGPYHSLILDEKGKLYIMGRIPSKQFSIDVTRCEIEEIKGNFPHFIKIGAGEATNIALDIDGKLWSWGVDICGNLGLGENVQDTKVPVLINSIISPVRHFCCSGRNTIAVDIDGNSWVWGDNTKGQCTLDNDVPSSAVPVLVDVTFARYCATGGGRVGIIDSEGNIWIWGNNRKQELGLHCDKEYLPTPTKIENLPPIFSLTMGLSHNLAVDMEGKLWSWGANGSGELGLGYTNDRTEPTLVDLPFTPHHNDPFAKAKSAKK